jgi:Haloacid dehalogenase-like hydrolase
MTTQPTIETYLMDMDGVLVHEERLIPGADQFISRLQDTGHRFLVVQDDRLALADRQGAQRLHQRQRLHRNRGGFGRGSHPQDRFGLAAQHAGPIGGQVHRHPAHPGLGGVVVTSPRPAHRSPGERLLHDLLGLMQVASHQEQLAEEPTDRSRVERLEAADAGHRLRLLMSANRHARHRTEIGGIGPQHRTQPHQTPAAPAPD